jgi:hypothetical protein
MRIKKSIQVVGAGLAPARPAELKVHAGRHKACPYRHKRDCLLSRFDDRFYFRNQIGRDFLYAVHLSGMNRNLLQQFAFRLGFGLKFASGHHIRTRNFLFCHDIPPKHF